MAQRFVSGSATMYWTLLVSFSWKPMTMGDLADLAGFRVNNPSMGTSTLTLRAGSPANAIG